MESSLKVGNLDFSYNSEEIPCEELLNSDNPNEKILNIVAEEIKAMPITIDLEEHPLYKKGLEKRLEKAKKEDAIRLYKETKWTPEKIAKILNISEEKVIRYLKEENLIKGIAFRLK
ncbi:MAG TPA: hypothetical protein EYG91_01150 [Aquifex aeolicus]|nr:hypothetical protein [Aquifex aeolicus]